MGPGLRHTDHLTNFHSAISAKRPRPRRTGFSARASGGHRHVKRNKTNRLKKPAANDPREQVLAVFADFAQQDVDKLFAFLQHCEIDLEPLADKSVQLPGLILSHFYI